MHAESYLFTFCPPGPDDRLKVISPNFRGIVLMSNVASHRLAAEFSDSPSPLSSQAFEAVERFFNSSLNLGLSRESFQVITVRMHTRFRVVLLTLIVGEKPSTCGIVLIT